MPRPKKVKVNEDLENQRKLCEASLEAFIEFIHPKRCLGNIHRRVIKWWTRSDAKTHQLLLLPRDHMKSALAGYRAAWELTRDPTLRILYISSTANLAIKQLKFIKDILTCENYRMLWPEMVEKEEAKREKWSEKEISVDHPKRKEWSIRDPSIFTAGLTTNVVGMHCDIAILDDVVVAANAYTEQGREKVKEQYGLLSSVETVNAKEIVVGTRYHPKDLYADLIETEIDQFDDVGNLVSSEPMFEKMEEQVESRGDGTGEFLWPRQQGKEGRWFGFDDKILATKRAQYKGNILAYRAQYYNDPNDVDSSPIGRDLFQYYDQAHLHAIDGKWFFQNKRLNVFAAVDFAYSLGKQSDYTCVIVIGVDNEYNYYVLEIDRFRTTKPSDYYKHILDLYTKWGFKKIRAEVSVAQKVIVEDLKDNYIRKNGLVLSVDEYRPSRWEGAKEERILATLEPKYANRQIWHYMGGNCQALEEELMFANPAHDDIKDALASAVDLAIPPSNLFGYNKSSTQHEFNYHSRFGGVI